MISSLIGDCRTILPTLTDKSVHCVVTSPPYFGLRDYGTAKWEGGDVECDHVGKRSVGKSTLMNDGREKPGILENHKVPGIPYRDTCLDCGAIRIDSQIGLEPTPQAYVEQMVAVFREVRRVLRDDGTLWLNLGDSYAGSWGNQGRKEERGTQRPINGEMLTSVLDGRYPTKQSNTGKCSEGLKPKDLIGIPWRVAFALQADGWYLRQDIIWSKPNPMPESVTDRCTKAHEYIFMLSKSPRYFYDNDAIKEPMKDVSLQRLSQPNVLNQPGGPKDPMNGNRSHKKAINNQAERLIKHEKWKTRFEGWDQYDKSLGRNKRSVWEIATQPFSEAHFATFPPALIEPCVMAGCPKGGTVLDPFGGAGTTGMVADRMGRNAILIELNPQYATIATDRIRDDAGMFADIN